MDVEYLIGLDFSYQTLTKTNYLFRRENHPIFPHSSRDDWADGSKCICSRKIYSALLLGYEK